MLMLTVACNYATKVSNTRSVVEKLVPTFLDYYKHIKRVITCNFNWWCYDVQATDIE